MNKAYALSHSYAIGYHKMFFNSSLNQRTFLYWVELVLHGKTLLGLWLQIRLLVLGLFKVVYWHIKNWREKFFPGIGLYKTLFVSNWNLYFQESTCVREKARGRKRRGEVAHRLLTNRERLGSGNFLKHIVCFTFCLPCLLLLESSISMFYFLRCGPISFPYSSVVLQHLFLIPPPSSPNSHSPEPNACGDISISPIYLFFPPALPPFPFLCFAFFSCAQRGSRLPVLVCRRVYSN